MKQIEKDIKLHELNLAYTRESREINRKKDIDIFEKKREIDKAHCLYLDTKRETLNVINTIREEKCRLSDGEEKELKEAHIRKLEQSLGLMKEEYLLEVEHIRAKHDATRRDLDEQARALSEWLEEAKLKVMKEDCNED